MGCEHGLGAAGHLPGAREPARQGAPGLDVLAQNAGWKGLGCNQVQQAGGGPGGGAIKPEVVQSSYPRLAVTLHPPHTPAHHTSSHPQLCDLYESDCIFDKFDCVMSGDGRYFATGTYSNFFRWGTAAGEWAGWALRWLQQRSCCCCAAICCCIGDRRLLLL